MRAAQRGSRRGAGPERASAGCNAAQGAPPACPDRPLLSPSAARRLPLARSWVAAAAAAAAHASRAERAGGRRVGSGSLARTRRRKPRDPGRLQGRGCARASARARAAAPGRRARARRGGASPPLCPGLSQSPSPGRAREARAGPGLWPGGAMRRPASGWSARAGPPAATRWGGRGGTRCQNRGGGRLAAPRSTTPLPRNAPPPPPPPPKQEQPTRAEWRRAPFPGSARLAQFLELLRQQLLRSGPTFQNGAGTHRK